MSRIIFISQFPAEMRYQNWFITEFEKEFKNHFDDVIVLGEMINKSYDIKYSKEFSPVNLSIEYELNQIKEYMNLELVDDDILFLADLSFPGLFTNVLHHKKPKKCFVYCHASSKNNYDYAFVTVYNRSFYYFYFYYRIDNKK